MYEKNTVVVPASIPTTLKILQDVESMDRWIRPHLPTWPRVTATTEVVRRADDGAPELVRVSSTVLGIGDRSLTEYDWSSDGYRAVLLESVVLANSSTAVDLTEVAGGTRLTLEVTADFKVRLPSLLERRFERLQASFRSALTEAIVAEARRVESGSRHPGRARG